MHVVTYSSLCDELLFVNLNIAVRRSLLTKYFQLNAKLVLPAECAVLNGLLGACK